MFFTQEDYKRIQAWLTDNAIKDTEFNDATSLNGNETIAFVQNGHNVKAPLKDFIAHLLLGFSDFLNVTEKFNKRNISLEQAIHLVPIKSRRIGQVITFLNEDNKWKICQFQGEEINQWNEILLWTDLIQEFIGATTVADEEDLTGIIKNDNIILKFKDKSYNEENFSGLGRIYLRKNFTEVISSTGTEIRTNTLTQQMLSKDNTIYIIQYDYDLGGKEITIPDNCVLKFEGGSFNNGTIIGNNSNITNDKDFIIFNNITIKGIWKVHDIYSTWFDFNYNSNTNNLLNLQNLFNLSSNDYVGTVHIDKRNFYVTIINSTTDSININSNTTVNLYGNIILNPTELGKYRIFTIHDKYNIVIQGSGSIVGDVENHIGTTGEWGMGISMRSTKNITIQGISIKKCWGDGIYIGQITEDTADYSSDILIDNITVDSNRRQGISVIAVKNLTIRNSKIINTGAIKFTSPGSGIDIEPNVANTMLSNINIEGCYFAGNTQGRSGDLLIANLTVDDKINFTFSATVSNCYFSTRIRLTPDVRNLTITSSYIYGLDIDKTGNAYYNVLISGCLLAASVFDINNPGIFYSGCSFINERGTEQRRVFSIGNTADKPVTKITFPKVDGLINLKIFSGFNAADLYCVEDVVIKGRYVNDANNRMNKASTTVYTDEGTGSIKLLQYRDHSVLVSDPIKAEDGSWEIYLKTYNNVYIKGIVIIEPIIYTASKSPFFGRVVVSALANAPENADFRTAFSQPCSGTTDVINSIMKPELGTVVYDTTLNKPVFGNGTRWVDATGASI